MSGQCDVVDFEFQTCGTGSYFRMCQEQYFKKSKELGHWKFSILQFFSVKAFGWDGQNQKPGTGTVQLSASYIAQGLGLNLKTVEKYTTELVRLGYLKKLRVSHKHGTTYAVTPILFVRDLATPETENKSENKLPIAILTNDLPKSELPTKLLTSYPPDNQLVTHAVTKNIEYRSIDISLSNKKLHERFDHRWKGMLPKEKEREKKGLLSLIKLKPKDEEVICKAFEIILADQAKFGKIICPIAILESNYTSQYRNRALQDLQKGIRLKEQEKAKQETFKAKEEADRIADLAFKQKMEALKLTSDNFNMPKNPLVGHFGKDSIWQKAFATNELAKTNPQLGGLVLLTPPLVPTHRINSPIG